MEYKVLNNGLKIPMVGLGVYNISERETQRVVEDAISVGYLNFFDFTLTDDDLHEIRLLDTGRNVTDWPSDALKYEVQNAKEI